MPPGIDCNPSAGRGSPYYFYTFQTRSLAVSLTGAQVNSVFPQAARVGLIDFQADVGLFSLVLATSLLNETAGDTVALAVGLDLGPVASLQGGINFFMSHLTRQNSTAAIRNANSKTNAMQMGQNTAYLLNSGQKLALYACSANAAGNELSAVLTAAWIPYIPGGQR